MAALDTTASRVEYVLPEEPPESSIARYACASHRIVTAAMLGGNWLGAPWFVFNAYALDSKTRRREIVLAALLPVVTLIAGGALMFAVLRGHLPIRFLEYGVIGVLAAKILVLYQLEKLQSASFKTHEALARRSIDGYVGLILAYVLRGVVVQAAFNLSPWLGWAIL